MITFEESVLELKTLIPETGEWGLVLYTDGGHRMEKKVGSWGLHGYIYDHVERKSGYGLTKCAPTSAGYAGPGIRTVDENGKLLRRSVKNYQEAIPVRIAAYIDAYGPFTGGTNNSAEALGVLNALKLIDALSPKQCQLVIDSEYAIKGTLLWSKDWVKNNWVKKDGEPVANKEIWLEVIDLLARVNAKTSLSWDWVKGHKDDVGNNHADLWSTKGLYAAGNGFEASEWEVSKVQKYWKPTVEVHPLLREPRLYLPVKDINRVIETGQVYFFGNVGPADGVEGQPTADRGYSVIHLPAPCPILSEVKNFFVDKCLVNRDIFLMRFRNDMISKAKIYKELEESGSRFLDAHPDKEIVKNAHTSKLSRGFGEAINPPELSFKLLDNLNGLERLLKHYQDDNVDNAMLSFDITDQLYQAVEAKKKTQLKYLAANKAALKVHVEVEHLGKKVPRLLPLTYGIDLASHATLRAVVNFNPKVEVVLWKRNAFTWCFATILTTDIGTGLWCGIYSNHVHLVDV